MTAITIKRGDTLPTVRATLQGPDKAPYDLSDASEVLFQMRPTSINSEATPISRAASIVSPTDGTVEFAWADGDTDIAGRYVAEFKVTFSGGGVLTFPNTGNIEVVITDRV